MVNPRYEGATIGMVVKVLLQRPKKADREDDGEPPDCAETGGA